MTPETRVQHDVADVDATPVAEHQQRSFFGAWIDRHHDRRTARHRRRLTLQLAELDRLQELVGDARAVIDQGWVQHAWFAYMDDRGQVRRVSSAAATDVAGRPLVGACLVGSVVYAAGGPHAVHSQPVQRALDLVWHALAADEGTPVLWCPAPDIRMARVRDLTRWNDTEGRTAADVAGVLLTAERVAIAESDRLVTQAAARGVAL